MWYKACQTNPLFSIFPHHLFPVMSSSYKTSLYGQQLYTVSSHITFTAPINKPQSHAAESLCLSNFTTCVSCRVQKQHIKLLGHKRLLSQVLSVKSGQLNVSGRQTGHFLCRRELGAPSLPIGTFTGVYTSLSKLRHLLLRRRCFKEVRS